MDFMDGLENLLWNEFTKILRVVIFKPTSQSFERSGILPIAIYHKQINVKESLSICL